MTAALLWILACGPKAAPEVAPAPAPASAPRITSKIGQNKDAPAGPPAVGDASDAEIIAWMNRPYNGASYRVAEATKADTALVDRIRDLLQMVYGGDLSGADTAVAFLDRDFPGTGMAEVGRVIVAAGRNAEDPSTAGWDRLREAVKRAEPALAAALAKPGSEALEEAALAAVLALGAQADAEQGRWDTARTRAQSAAQHVSRARELAPALDDIALLESSIAWWRGLGVSKGAIQEGTDARPAALLAMRNAEKKADLLGPAATLALARAQLHDGDARSARDRLLRLQRYYPESVSGELLLAESFLGTKQLGEATRIVEVVGRKHPQNLRAQLLRASVQTRSGKLDEADRTLEALLARPGLETTSRADILTRQARVALRRGKSKVAVELLEQAVAASPSLEATLLLAKVKSGKPVEEGP